MNKNGRHKVSRKYKRIGAACAVIIVTVLACYLFAVHSGSVSAFLKKLLNILMPFIWGGAIAYILAPLCGRLENFFGKRFPKRKKLSAALSIAISLIAAVLVVAAFLVLVIPSLTKSIIQLINAIPGQIESLNTELHNYLAEYPQMQDIWDSVSETAETKINEWINTDLIAAARTLAGSLGSSFSVIFRIFKNVFLGMLISVYLLAGRKKLAAGSKKLLYAIVPERPAALVEEEVRYADKMFNGFLAGRVIDSVIIGIICFIFTFICRFDSAVFVSVVVGVTNIIPYFGPYIGAVPCAFILLLENPVHCIIFLIFIVVLQLLDGNVIGPHIVGQATGVSSFGVLFSVMLFGGLWGIIGMLIGVPLFAVITDVIKKLLAGRLNNKNDEESAEADGELMDEIRAERTDEND